MFEHGFPTDWSTLKKLIWLVGAGIVGGASAVWKTVTGALIHITDALASPMQKCEVTLEPIQDLHGQDAPYPAGGGVNKFDESTVEFSKWISSDGAVNTQNVNYGCISQKIPANAQSYSFKDFGETPYSFSICEYASDDTFIKRTHTNGSPLPPIQITLDASTAYIVVQVACHPDVALTSTMLASFKMELSEGSTFPDSYSPFANICPITGWTGCEVWDDPKYGGLIEWNQLAKEFNSDNWIEEGSVTASYVDGVATFSFPSTSGNGIQTRDNVSIVNGHKYYCTIDIKSPSVISNDRVRFGGHSSTGIVAAVSVETANTWLHKAYIKAATGSVSNNKLYIYVTGTAYEMSAKNFMLVDLTAMFGAGNEPSTVAEFEALFPKDYYPYNTGEETTVSAVNGDPYQHLSVTFPDGQTVYGCTVDFVSGLLTVIYAKKHLVASDFTNFFDAYKQAYALNLLSNAPAYYDTSRATYLCDTFKSIPNFSKNTNVGNFATLIDNGNSVGFSGNASSLEEFKALIPNGIDFVYQLATPIEIQLTPQEISTLAGENNIWSDAQSMTVTYKADGRASDVEALNMLLGGTYQNQGNPDDVSDKEALQILLGDKS